jgi:hypothetical protein
MIPTSSSPLLFQSSSLSPPPPTSSHILHDPYNPGYSALPAVRKALDFDSCRNDIQRAALAKLVAGNTSSIKKCLLEAGFCDAQANNRTMQMRVRRHVQKLQDQQNPPHQQPQLPSNSNAIRRMKAAKAKADFVPPSSIVFVPTRRSVIRSNRQQSQQHSLQDSEDHSKEGDDQEEQVVFDDDISVLTEISDLVWGEAMRVSCSTAASSAVVAAAAARSTLLSSSLPLELLATATRNAAVHAVVATGLLPSTTNILPPSNNNSHNHKSMLYLPPPGPMHFAPTAVSPLPPSETTATLVAAAAAAEATFLRPEPMFRSSLQAVRDIMAHPALPTAAVASVPAASTLFLQQQGASAYQQQIILPSPLFR